MRKYGFDEDSDFLNKMIEKIKLNFIDSKLSYMKSIKNINKC